MQYLLQEGVRPTASNDWGLFASGLLTYTDSQKPGYGAWRLPLYMPRTSARRGRPLEVWGCARPAHFAYLDTGLLQGVQAQFRHGSRGAFKTVRSIGLRPDSCYFDVRQSFPASGTVRLAYTFPSIDPQLRYVDPLAPHTIYSRQVHLTVR